MILKRLSLTLQLDKVKLQLIFKTCNFHIQFHIIRQENIIYTYTTSGYLNVSIIRTLIIYFPLAASSISHTNFFFLFSFLYLNIQVYKIYKYMRLTHVQT